MMGFGAAFGHAFGMLYLANKKDNKMRIETEKNGVKAGDLAEFSGNKDFSIKQDLIFLAYVDTDIYKKFRAVDMYGGSYSFDYMRKILTPEQQAFKDNWEGKKMTCLSWEKHAYVTFDSLVDDTHFTGRDQNGVKCIYRIDVLGVVNSWIEWKPKKLVFRDDLMYVRSKDYEAGSYDVILIKCNEYIRTPRHMLTIEYAHGWETDKGEPLTREVDCDE